MPKQKTHKGLKKRLRVTASGKVMYKRSCGGHLMSGKNAKRRRRIGHATVMDAVSARKIRIAMGL